MIAKLACALAALFLLAAPAGQAAAQPAAVHIVAIGASNTWGFGLTGRDAYPERLEDLLKAAGYDARVVNAGVNFDTTAGMLSRLDAAVPPGTHIVIVQPGGNDRRFFVSEEHRAANIEAMKQRLAARNIAAIVYDPAFAPRDYQWDGIHLTADTHARIAAELVPQVTEIVKQRAQQSKKDAGRPKQRR